MKAIKKILTLMLVLCMVFAMTACGSDDDDDDKKGESRKTEATKEADKPTDEPTAEPTDEPTSEPAASVSFDTIKGLWKCNIDLDGKTFADMAGQKQIETIFTIFKNMGFDPKAVLHFEVDFMNETTAKITFEMDATSIGEAMKQALSTEDGIIQFYSAMTGQDAENIKAMLAKSGMTAADIAASINVDSMMGNLKQSQSQDAAYKINGNVIEIAEAEVNFEYDKDKNCLMFKILETAVNENPGLAALFTGAVLTR